MKKGPYKVTSSKIVYKNPWLTVTEDEVIRPEGEKGIFGVSDLGSGVSILALNADNEVIMIREYHYAIERYLWQLPAGTIENHDAALATAKRELVEETGYEAKTWKELGMVHPLTMILRCPSYLFLATDLEKKGEPELGIEVDTMPFNDVYKMAIDGELVHAPSIVAVLKAKIFLDDKMST